MASRSPKVKFGWIIQDYSFEKIMIIDVRIFDMSFNGENLGSDLNYGPGVSFWARLVLKQDLKRFRF